MGQYPIGDYVIPGLRENLYGRFAVNLGVVLPAIPQIEHGGKMPNFFREYDCEIRERLGALVYKEDVWWDLDHLVEQTATKIVHFMDQTGIPFLDRFDSYASVLATIDSDGSLPFGNPARSALVGAMASVHLKQTERALTYFNRAVELAGDHKGFAAHVAQVRSTCGL